jgi:hypothetical protein
MLAALLLFIRAPRWHVRRRYFVAIWCFCTAALLVPNMVPPRLVFDGLLVCVIYPFGMFLFVLVSQEFTLSARPVPWGHRIAAVLTLLLFFALLATLSFARVPDVAELALRLFALPFAVTAMATDWCAPTGDRSPRTPPDSVGHAGRYGRCGQALLLTVGFAVAVPLSVIAALTSSGLVAPPLGVVISVIGYGWLDVDWLISATASYSSWGWRFSAARSPRFRDSHTPRRLTSGSMCPPDSGR